MSSDKTVIPTIERDAIGAREVQLRLPGMEHRTWDEDAGAVWTRLRTDWSDRPLAHEPRRASSVPLLSEAPCRDSRVRLAWRERASILCHAGRPALARQFLQSLREHARQSYSVSEAARDLGVGRSTLERLSLGWFGLPPGLVINLGRVTSVSEELDRTDEPLKVIAQSHSFSTVSNMGRMFACFTGVPPGAYRGRSRLQHRSESGQVLTRSEY